MLYTTLSTQLLLIIGLLQALQPKGWIKIDTDTEEHKVNAIIQSYNKTLTYSLNITCSND